MTLTWEEAEVAALDRPEWRRSVAQCIHLDAGWIKVKVKELICEIIWVVHRSSSISQVVKFESLVTAPLNVIVWCFVDDSKAAPHCTSTRCAISHHLWSEWWWGWRYGACWCRGTESIFMCSTGHCLYTQLSLIIVAYNFVHCQPTFIISGMCNCVHYRKFATSWYLASPPNMVYVTTLPCKIVIVIRAVIEVNVFLGIPNSKRW